MIDKNEIKFSQYRREVVAMKIYIGDALSPNDMRFIYSVLNSTRLDDTVKIHGYKPVMPKHRPNRRTTLLRNLEMAFDYDLMRSRGDKHSDIVKKLYDKHGVMSDKALEGALKDGRTTRDNYNKQMDAVWKQYPDQKPYLENLDDD